MRIRPRRLLKELSQRTGASWFRGPHLIRARDVIIEDPAGQCGSLRDDDDSGVEHAKPIRRARAIFQ
jgi:hypothetical protein